MHLKLKQQSGFYSFELTETNKALKLMCGKRVASGRSVKCQSDSKVPTNTLSNSQTFAVVSCLRQLSGGLLSW